MKFDKKKFITIPLTAIGFFVLKSSLSSLAGFLFSNIFKSIWDKIRGQKDSEKTNTEE